MHPKYPDLEASYRLVWKESLDIPVQPFSPDWKFPMLDVQLQGDDLQRFNQDLKEIVLEKNDLFRHHSHPSKKAQERHPESDTSLTATYEDWNLFYVDHPAVECLFYVYKQAHDVFLEKVNASPGLPTNILCWANAIEQNGVMGEHAHQGKTEATYISGNYCVNADEDTATVFDTPGFGSRHIKVWNKPGQLTMFPQWVDHWTTEFDRGDDDVRVTIAADIDVGYHGQLNIDDTFDERRHYLPFDRPPHEKARREDLDLESVPAIDPEVSEFVNTPLEEVREKNIEFDFEGH